MDGMEQTQCGVWTPYYNTVQNLGLISSPTCDEISKFKKNILIFLSESCSTLKLCGTSITPTLGFQYGASKAKNGENILFFLKFELISAHILVIWNN